MSVHKELVEKGIDPVEWPYPVNYGMENEVSADVLVLGGGLSGCWAAISAARKGLKVAIVEKGCTAHSGSGGAGIDHWHSATTNPCSKVTPEEFAQAEIDCLNGYKCGIEHYICCRESYDTLLELEKMGMKIRDTEDEFKGAEFRDEETKLVFAYDYENRYCITIWGTGMKSALYNQCKRLGVDIYDRLAFTSLLTEGGKQGAKVVGATGLSVRTGEFFIFKAKAIILCTGSEARLWWFSSEHRSLYSERPPQIVGEGFAAAWRAGAEFSLFEKSIPLNTGGLVGIDMVHYYGGYWDSEWRPCNMVDATGKEIPWVDRDGNVLSTVSQRNRPAPGQKFFLPNLFVMPPSMIPPSVRETLWKYREPQLMRGIRKRMASGELVAPLYADLPSMPEHERRAIFGLHMGQEGKTWIGYRMLTQAGFDPDKHMLQFYPVVEVPRARYFFFNSGGFVPDWDLRTNLEGLYVAGEALLTSHGAAHACTTGKYAGRKAAEYALGAAEPVVDHKQVENEKARVYGPVSRRDGMDWKELNIGVCQIMQLYCGDVKNEESLKIGLKWLKELKEQEATKLWARNPHELGRTLESLSIITVAEMVIHASLARKASSVCLNFHRSDYPEMDPPEWHKWVTTKLEGDKVKSGELPIDYWGPLKENYEAHCGL